MSDTTITVYKRDGQPLEDLSGSFVTRSWVLNRSGVATFTIPRGLSTLTEFNIRYGNPIVIQNDRVGIWGGFIWLPREHPFDGVKVWARSAEALLSRRRITGVYATSGMSAGTMFASLIELANAKEDTLIRVDSIFSGGRIRSFKYANMLIGDAVVGLQKSTGIDWSIEPDISTGRLIFLAQCYERRGRIWQFGLLEGKNIKLNLQPVLLEQGELVNDTISVGLGATSAVTPYRAAADSATNALYGLSEGLVQARGSSDAELESAAAADLDKRKNPRRTYRITAIDDDNTFDYLGLGDTLPLKLASYGLTAAGVGVEARVRVIAKEYSDLTGEMALTLDEVIT